MIYNKKNFMEDLLFFPKIVAKGYMFISLWKVNGWGIWSCVKIPKILFPNRKQMVQHTIPSLVAKTMDHYVMLTLDFHVTTFVFIYLWIS
jgi:hypothetical protein